MVNKTTEQRTGKTIEDAIIIIATGTEVGVEAEYEFISKILGPEGETWEFFEQSLLFNSEHKPYDQIKVEMLDGSVRNFYFDISSFFGFI